MSRLIKQFGLEKSGFKNMLLLLVLVVFFGVVSIIARVLIKDGFRADNFKIAGITDIAEAQAQCWVPAGSCASPEGCETDSSSSSSSSDSSEAAVSTDSQ